MRRFQIERERGREDEIERERESKREREREVAGKVNSRLPLGSVQPILRPEED